MLSWALRKLLWSSAWRFSPIPWREFCHHSTKILLYLSIEKLKCWQKKKYSFSYFCIFRFGEHLFSAVPNAAKAEMTIICLFIQAVSPFILWVWMQPPALKQCNCFHLHHRRYSYLFRFLFIYIFQQMTGRIKLRWSNTDLEPAKQSLIKTSFHLCLSNRVLMIC